MTNEPGATTNERGATTNERGATANGQIKSTWWDKLNIIK